MMDTRLTSRIRTMDMSMVVIVVGISMVVREVRRIGSGIITTAMMWAVGIILRRRRVGSRLLSRSRSLLLRRRLCLGLGLACLGGELIFEGGRKVCEKELYGKRLWYGCIDVAFLVSRCIAREVVLVLLLSIHRACVCFQCTSCSAVIVAFSQ